MAPDPPTEAPAPGDEARRRRRQGGVVLGLLLSIVGVFLVSVELPVGPGPLERLVPIVGAGLFALWLGGILMGLNSGQRTRGGG